MKTLKQILSVAALCLLAAGVQATTKEWLHIHVNDSGDSGEKVRVNIPLSLVEVMLPMVEEKELSDGKIRINDKNFKVADLLEIWNAVKNEGDSEFVSVQKKGENVRVFTKGNFLMVESDKNSNGKVNIKMPMAVVDAMLSGDEESLNLAAAVKALRESGVKDIISVQDDDTNVMVWIDDKNLAAERE